MAEYSLGASGAGFEDTIRRAQAAAAAQDELNRKEAQRRASEEQTAAAEESSAQVRTGLVGATETLTAALGANVEALRLETTALNASNIAMERSLTLRRQVAEAPIAGATRTAGVAGAGAFVGNVEDPAARARLTAAYTAQAAAEQRAKAAGAAYTTALKPGTTVGAEDAALLLQQREQAAAQVQAAKAETAAAQTNVRAQEQLGAERQVARQQQAQINAALTAERQAQQRQAAAAEAAANAQAEVAAKLRIAVAAASASAGTAGLSSEARAVLGTSLNLPRTGSSAAVLSAAGYGGGVLGTGARPWLGTVTGGPANATALPQDAEAAARLEKYRNLATENSQALEGMAGRQAAANVETNAAAAAYADASTALSRHGALTTEFIGALARGQVTLGEFGSQLTATAGKFGGWVLAGGAVFGIVKLFEDLTKGATETQAAIQQLGRFIPGLGGPAGGGSGQVPAAESAVRDISTQFNVPITEVVSTMSVLARTFHTVDDAAQATRAALAVSRLDLVTPQQAEQYLPAISRSFGFSSGGQLIGVINGLNQLQSQFGARVSETLPAIARAAPAAVAAGTSQATLAGLAALGVRAGLPGTQVGTALLRSQGTFAFRPASDLTFREYGLNPVGGQYGDLVHQIFGLIDRRIKEGQPLTGPDLNRLAQGLGGPLLGSRAILPLLVQEALHPGTFRRGEEAYQHPRPYQEDLGAVLSQVSEKFKAIGIGLQNFGSQLASSGFLAPLTGLLDVVTALIHGVEGLIGPITATASVFNELPQPVRDAIGLFVAFRALRALSSTTLFGRAQNVIGQLPGFGFARNNAREAVADTLARYQTYLLPEQQRANETAQRRLYQAGLQRSQAYDDQAHYQAQAEASGAAFAAQGPASEEYTKTTATLNDRIARAQTAYNAAETEAAAQAETFAKMEAQKVVLQDKSLSYAQREAFLESQGLVASTEIVDLKEQYVAAFRAQLAGLRGTAAIAGAGGAGAENEAALAALTTRVVGDVARNPAAVGSLARGVAAAGAAVVGGATAGGVLLPRGVEQQPGVRSASVPEVVPPPPLAEEAVTSRTLLDRISTIGYAAQYAAGTPGRLRDVVAEQGGPLPFLQEKGGSALTSGGLAFAGILGSQLLGSTIGGSTGRSIADTASTAFTGLLAAQLLKPGSATASLAGLGIGLGVAGHQTGGTTGGIESAIGFGTAGTVIGAALAPETGGLSLAIPAIAGIASAIGGYIFGSSGGSQPQSATDQGNAATAAALRLISRNVPGLAAVEQQNASPLQQRVSQQLETAFLGTGQGSQQAQARVGAIVQALTAQVQLAGGNSPLGRQAEGGLGTVIQAAIGLIQSDPNSAQQLIQAATQTRNTEVQRQLQYNISTGSGPNAGAAAARTAIGQYHAIAQPFATAATAYHQQLADAQATLAGLEVASTGDTKAQQVAMQRQIDAQRRAVAALQQQSSDASAVNRLAQENAKLQEQQAAQAGYSADIQTQQANSQLKVSQAGGNVLDQLKAKIAGYQQQLKTTQNFPGLDPRTRANDIAQIQASIIDAQNQAAQQAVQVIQAHGAVSQAQVPIGDPVGQAKAALTTAAQVYQYMTAHAHSFDPTAILQAYAGMIAAQHNLAQTASDYAIQITSIQGQIAQAHDYGDAVAQAQDAINTANQQLAEAVTPEQQQTATANLAAAQNQLHQAYQQRIQSEGQLAASQHPGDAVAAAQAIVNSAQAALANARGADEIIAAQTALNNANNQLYQAVTQATDTQYQTQQTQATGNAVYQAAIERARALYDLSRARGPTETAQAQAELAQANVAAHQAQQQRTTEYGSLQQALEQGNTLEAARTAVNTALSVLSNARGTDELIQAEQQLAQAEYQLTQARLQRIGALATLHETQETGNSVAQAQTALAAAQRQREVVSHSGVAVRQARQVLQQAEQHARAADANATPEQVRADQQAVADARAAYAKAAGARRDEQIAARERVAQAEAQLRQARQGRVQERGDLRSARNEDPVAQARTAVETAKKELDLAHGEDQRLQAEATLARAEFALHQARVQRITELGQLAEAQAQGDPVAQAQIEIQVAEETLARAKTEQERIAAETQLAQAELALHQALQQRITDLGALAASTTRDPLLQLTDQINAARRVLAGAVTQQEQIQAQTNLNQLLNQYTSTLVQQTEDTINFQLNMHQITAQQAIAQLEGLLKTKNLTLQEQHQIEEQIRQLQLGGGTSEFNLAPGSVKLPTIYDIARAMGVAGAGASSPFGTGTVSATANTTINVEVANSEDVPKVAAAIDAATGSTLAGTLRAAGLT